LDLALLLDEVASDPTALGEYAATRRARLLRDGTALRTGLETLARVHPGSPLAPIVLFELAGTLEDDRQPAAAQARYEEILAAHPQHRLAPRALEALGDLQAGPIARPDLAVESYERLLMDYPDDLFLDGVRKKLLDARAAAKEAGHATP
jgi:tetratricopeptide (TPR) repeat protein